MRLDYSIADVAPYINWVYFYYAWGMSSRPAAERHKLRAEAEDMLKMLDRRYATHVVFELCNANGDGDDIVLGNGYRLPMLRQQRASPTLCLSDFVRPLSSGLEDRIGLFAATVDIGLETDFGHDDYQKMMVQLLADRLAEATAEKMHQEVRTHYWGYASGEQLSVSELHAEKFQGIRPAVGYPSLPDTSINFLLGELLDMKGIGIRLTGSGAMKPHASVSGLMLSHPQSRYFTIGKIGDDQLCDYARRRGVPVAVMRKFLGSILQ